MRSDRIRLAAVITVLVLGVTLMVRLGGRSPTGVVEEERAEVSPPPAEIAPEEPPPAAEEQPPRQSPPVPLEEAEPGTVYLLPPAWARVGESYEVPVVAVVGDLRLHYFALGIRWDPQFLRVDAIEEGGGGFPAPSWVDLDPGLGMASFSSPTRTVETGGALPVASIRITILARPPDGVARIEHARGRLEVVVADEGAARPRLLEEAVFLPAELPIR